MKTFVPVIAALFSCLSVCGQGTVLIQNNLGATIYKTILPDGTTFAGSDYKVEVFTFSGNASSPFGTQIGPTMSFQSNGRFTGGQQVIPGAEPGSTPQMIARYWDTKTGADYSSALLSGHTGVWTSAPLGGGGIPPSVPVSMVSGLPGGYPFFVPEPASVALGLVGVIALMIRLRSRDKASLKSCG